MLNAAAIREISDSTAQGGVGGPTVASYRKALEVVAEKSSIDIQLLAIPGLREPAVTDFAIDKTEERFDALYIMDIEECDYTGTAGIVTGSVQEISVTNTAAKLQARSLDTSFAAAYFPDCLVRDPASGANVRCPPSVAVLGAMSLNDSVAHPWFAPAGFTRGALATTEQTQVKLNRANLDTLYEVDINPITSFPTSPGVVVFGQKTLQQAQSALDRVNVRRLLIDIRRKVRNVANTIIFEPNRESTLARFSAAVQPILARIQAQQGLDRFKVVIDSSTTTQLDVENNTVRGKIFLQPTKSVEFISLDFVVTNQGAEI
jgi:phage tail sheath protein FI